MDIAILESLGIPFSELERLEKPFCEGRHSFRHYERTADISEICARVKGADAVILANMPFPKEAVGAADRLKYIDVAFTGLDHIAMDAAKARGIRVKNAAGYSDEAVAELALGMALSLSRNISAVSERCRNGGTKDGLVGCEIRGKTVGIVGLGRIGRRSAELFHALGAEILASSRTVHADKPEYVSEVALNTLLSRSDIVLLHCPLTDETRGLINAGKITMMKKSAILINLARGPVVDSSALAEALNNGIIAGAGVDVFDKEPPLPSSEPLLHAKNVLLTPHIAFATKESMLRRAEIVFDNLEKWIAETENA